MSWTKLLSKEEIVNRIKSFAESCGECGNRIEASYGIDSCRCGATFLILAKVRRQPQYCPICGEALVTRLKTFTRIEDCLAEFNSVCGECGGEEGYRYDDDRCYLAEYYRAKRAWRKEVRCELDFRVVIRGKMMIRGEEKHILYCPFCGYKITITPWRFGR